MTAVPPPYQFHEELLQVVQPLEPVWQVWRRKKILLTGGTGFIGHWLTHSFLLANQLFKLDSQLVLLTRDAARARRIFPNHLPGLEFFEGDVRSRSLQGHRFDCLIHGAVSPRSSSEEAYDVLVQGTRHLLQEMHEIPPQRLCCLSSGAVYRPQRRPIRESDSLVADSPAHDYASGKVKMEELCREFAYGHSSEVVVARAFAFVGPHLSLDYAVQDFIHQALLGDSIQLKGDGSAFRSYLYAADMTSYLWRLIFSAPPGGTYNLGAEEGYALEEVARKVGDVFGGRNIVLGSPSQAGLGSTYYVPDMSRTRHDLGLEPRINFSDAIQKTAAWMSQTHEGQ